MNINKLTNKSRESLGTAQTLSATRDHAEVTSLHLLSALLEDMNGPIPAILGKVGVSTAETKKRVEEQLKKQPRVSGDTDRPVSRGLQQVLEQSFREAEKLKDEFVSQDTLFLAIIEKSSETKPVFEGLDLTYDRVLKALVEIRGSQRVMDAEAEGRFQVLDRYCRNLTELAQNGKLDPVVGRDDEVRRVLEVLARRTKNNPVLIGDPGVGKTAIVEGIALRIARGDVPSGMKDLTVLQLDLGAMIAGAKYRGEFEDRLKSVLKEITESNGTIVLFIDELHTLVGAGAAEGAMDASNMLKPALARGELHTIGATTLDEYRKYIEKDAALARRFQPVLVGEPTVEDTVQILRGLKEKYEVHHGIRIRDAALVAAAQLSDRYINDRFLPDKAIDLVDEAASRIRLESDSLPAELEQLQRKLINMEIERQALRKEKDPASKERLKELEDTQKDTQAQFDQEKSRWDKELEAIQDIRRLKEDLEATRTELELTERRSDYNKAAEIKYGVLPDLEKRLLLAEASLRDLQTNGSFLREEVSEEDIAQVVSRWTGIPVSKMLESEQQKLLTMEDRLRMRVIGQEEALEKVSDCIRRARADLKDDRRPLGSFLFLGPTGVGKTELARSLAEFLFDDEDNMVRIDMSEYMERHAVSRLIGAPPGYVGYDEGGQLTERVRRRPYSVILFDEVEKAHPEVFNILLQLLDDGRLTDGHGRTVDFRNTIVIMTSNVGSEAIQKEQDPVKMRQIVEDALQAHFRPEFLNRLDETIIFHALGKEHLRKIVDIQLRLFEKRLQRRQLHLEITEEAKTFLGEEGYDPVFGARPLKRAIQRLVEAPLAKMVLGGQYPPGSTVQIDVKDGELVFTAPHPFEA
ncbi:MAG: ATP-dependent chaperone ClpB [Myxococcales bacterium]|nr:ATP-dependent chaperone ClpB [Myxococcales bacterium]